MSFPTTASRRCPHVLLAATMAALFAGCSDPAPDARGDATPSAVEDAAQAATPPGAADAAAAPTTTAPAAPADAGAASAGAGAATGATTGGDGSQIVLAPLSETDVEGAGLTGELACSFAIGDAPPLLLARGDVASKEPARGVVKVGDYVETVAAPGGFDAMLEGARFSGAGKTVSVALTGAATGGGESPPAPATLIYDRADGARRSFAGQWQCGP